MEAPAREVVGREGAISAPPRDIPIREPGTTQSSRTFDGSSSRTFDGSSSRTFGSSQATHRPYHHPDSQRQDVWAGAIARLQTQVSYNTSMLETNRRQLSEVEIAIKKLDGDMNMFVNGMNQLRDECRARSASSQLPRHDVGDLDVLSRQVQGLTDKVSEVEGLKMQIDLMKNRMRRVEEQGSPPAPAAGRSIAPPHREPSFGESQHSQQPPAHQPARQFHQPLPPMRTSSMSSPSEGRPSILQQPPPPMTVLQSQHSGSSYYPSTTDSRHMSSEPLSGQASSVSGYRPGEPLPPPSAITAWRPAEPSQPPAGHPPPPSGPVQPPPVRPEAPTSGWAAVNAHRATKRSFDGPGHSQYESSGAAGSPKRPKLAPIMPRGGYHEDSASYIPSQSTAESSYNLRDRTGSNASQTQPSMLPTPSSTSTPAYRFITSTASADSQESWRPESERMLHNHQHPPGGRARGKGGRGGGRGRRGGRAGEAQELDTPEWEKPGWTGSQISPNGYYRPLHPYSPRQERGELIRRGGGMVGGPGEHEHISPVTPMVRVPQDPFAVGPVGGDPQQQNSGGKKSRTKPIRNAEGILIRKDGRPDMRSVSSANNLRKVHAKKEAERAEMEGRTPTSARSLAPAGSNSLSEGDETGGSGDEQEHDSTQERHQAFMNRIFPEDVNEASRGVGERFFPRQEASDTVAIESESQSHDAQQSERSQQPTVSDSQMTDIDRPALSEAQAEEHRRSQDTKMPTVHEASQERETEEERREVSASAEQTAASSNTLQ